MKAKSTNFSARLLLLLCIVLCMCSYNTASAQFIYANKITDSTADFQHAYRAADSDQTNYAYISNLVGVLNTSYLRFRFPTSGRAGDVVNVAVQADSQTVGLSLLNSITIRLYDSLGNNVKSGSGSSVLQLSLLSTGTNTYAIRFFTNPSDTFTFKEARVDLNNILTLNLLNQFRIYNVFYQKPCPPVYADSVYTYGTNTLLTGYVSNPSYSVDANPNNVSTLTVPLNLLSLLPPAYLDLRFSQPGKAGDRVGFTVGQASSLLSLSLLQNLEARIYDENNNLQQVYNGFSLADLELLSGSGGRYSLAFTSQAGNYKISRVRLTLKPVLGLLENLNVYNAFHYTVDRPPVMVSSSGPLNFCSGGSVTLTATDTLGAISYHWNTGATTPSITVTQSGTYYVVLEDSLACARRSLDIAVQVNPRPVPQITGDTVLCAGASGNLHTSVPYTSYNWSNATTGSNIGVNATGKYYVTVMDANHCTGSDTVMVQSNNLSITPTITATACSNTGTGAVSLNVAGGSGLYAYRWSNGNTGNNILNLNTGIYTARIKDSIFGCVYNRAFTVTANNTLSLKTAVVNTSGCGNTDGHIALNVIGGGGNYTYLWNNGATTANLDGIAAGLYTVTVTDAASGCQSVATIAVSDANSLLSVTPVVTGAASCGTLNGSIVLTVLGGSGNYSYSWGSGATTATLTGLVSGTYYVRVKDNTTQCTKALTISVPNLTNIVVGGTVTPAACNQNNGNISTSITGGLGLYTYSWSNGAATANISNLQAGVYLLNITDNTSGCTAQKVFTVGETGGPSASLNITQPGCATNSNGAITVTASGNLNYKWSNGSLLKDQVNLKAGTYGVTVTDSISGCSSLYTAVLLPKTQLQLTASPKVNTACLLGANGAVNVSVSGGTAPYTYLWSTGATVANLLNIQPGNYTLNVQDAGGCTSSITVPVITDSSKLLNISLGTVVKASCNAATNGSVNISVLGGALPYTYLWSNGATTANLTNVGPGTYTLAVTDLLGCVKQIAATVGIDSTNLLGLTLDSAHAAGCSGSTSGGLYITAFGGTAPYTYSWSNGSTIQDLVNITAGSYAVTVTDQNHCTAQISANVPVSNTGAISLTVDSLKKATCQVSADGKIYVHASGGTMPYTYAWSNGATTQNLLNVNPGVYTLTAVDANGCPGQVTATLGIDTALTLKVSLDSLRGAGCIAGNNAAIFITPSGGTTPYTYSWSNGTTVQDLLNIHPGTYSVSVTDAKGCVVIKLAQATVDTSKTPRVTIDSVSGAGCIGSNSGGLYITASHGATPYTYIWSNGAVTEDLANVAPGSYTVSVNDASGCAASKTATVNVDPNKQIHILLDSVVGATCITSHTGNVLVSVNGGQAPYTYAWSNGSTAQDLSGVMPGAYTLMVTDASGCTAQLGSNVGVDTSRSIHVIAGTIGGAGCQGSASGSISVQVNGGTVPYMYTWSNGATTQNITHVTPGSYSLTVTDAAGCIKQFNANVGVDTANKLMATVHTIIKARCTGSLSGSVDVDITGGVQPYTYNWSNGATSQDLSYVASGSYSLTVSDAVGCNAQLSVNVGIDASNPVVASVDSVIGIGCADSTSGQVYVSVHGGVSPYTYLWSNGATTEDLLNISAGSYMLIVTDDAGCKASVNANVIKIAPFTISAAVKNISCYGLADGAVTITVSGGSSNYQYNWSNGAATQSVNSLVPGNYMLTVTDKSSLCTKTETYNIHQPDSLSAFLAVVNDGCPDGDDGKITLTVSGGTTPYRYAWSNGAVASALTNLAPATYTVTVTDENGCTKNFAATVGKDDCNFTITVHDIITPNGDGMNDLWVIEGIENYPGNKIELYNKWGNLVYDKTGYDNHFSGRGNSGDELPDGTYYYILKLNATNKAGGKSEFTGFMMINR